MMEMKTRSIEGSEGTLELDTHRASAQLTMEMQKEMKAIQQVFCCWRWQNHFGNYFTYFEICYLCKLQHFSANTTGEAERSNGEGKIKHSENSAKSRGEGKISHRGNSTKN
jgi:hypothetical protein